MSDVKNSFLEQLYSDARLPFFCDLPADRDKMPPNLCDSSQFSLLTSRHKLREFCSSQKLTVPQYAVSEQFARLSAWAVKFNRFPLIMKTSTNLADGRACYILKAFRELPEFFELITGEFPGPVMLEEFINPKARIEITFLNGAPRIIAQVSLDKSLKLRHSWRAFPVRLPTPIISRMLEITRLFSALVDLKDTPIRFSFAVTATGPVLTAINSGYNRPEYHPEWRSKAGIVSLAESKTETAAEKFCKILHFYECRNDEISEGRLRQAAETSLCQWARIEDQAIIMLRSENTATLLEDSKRIAALFKHLVE
ncbi:MAG TPA: hypothetical protein PKI71_02555 [Candidatus Rifleibacterium sp.]|nr:hypothetical protein [Candidatus Rifleibacterium sp.]